MRARVEVKPALLRWARDRAGMRVDDLARRFPRLAHWETGEARPTRRQLERFAKATHATVDHLLMARPPVERVPIPDLRATGNGRIRRPSPNLLDMLSLCRQRQAWYRDFARGQGDKPLAFVGSASLKNDIDATAAAMRSVLGLDLEERQKISAWDKTMRRLIDHADALGILVMVNGVVGNNSYRRLDPQEFRGFALADARAPLVFINGADAKPAQMFTLAHALAHIWLGQSALSDVTPIAAPEHEVERWCSAVAAEILVPLGALRAEYRRGEELRNALTRLIRRSCPSRNQGIRSRTACASTPASLSAAANPVRLRSWLICSIQTTCRRTSSCSSARRKLSRKKSSQRQRLGSSTCSWGSSISPICHRAI
jgi:Zn-dependent peptidase ImmA (M78 family)